MFLVSSGQVTLVCSTRLEIVKYGAIVLADVYQDFVK
jgi:hypothetical protein